MTAALAAAFADAYEPLSPLHSGTGSVTAYRLMLARVTYTAIYVLAALTSIAQLLPIMIVYLFASYMAKLLYWLWLPFDRLCKACARAL